MYAESANAVVTAGSGPGGAKDAIYIGSRSSVRISAVVERQIKFTNFTRWKSREVPCRIAAMLESRGDFIVGDYPLRKISRRHASGRVLLQRNGALGDVLVLVPAVRRIKELLPFTFSLSCGKPYIPLFKRDDTFDEVIATGSKSRLPTVGKIGLDGVLERDITWEEGRSMPCAEWLRPRAIAYFEFLAHGFDVPLGFRPDYSIATDEQDQIWAERAVREIKRKSNGSPLVLVQARGSAPVRSIGRDRMIEVTKHLAEKFTVVVSDRSGTFTWKDESIGIFALYGRSVTNMIALLRMCDAAVVTDSGTLWLAHSANIPTVAILGPTREQERLSTHGLYPSRARAVNTAAMSGCEPCFENAVRCRWKYDCMHALDISTLASKIIEALDEVIKDGD